MFEKWRSTLPRKEVCLEGEPYLTRWYLGTFLGHHFLLHCFHRPDPDRGLHNHPWDRAYSIVLRGWYLEQRLRGVDCVYGPRVKYRKVRWFNRLTGLDMHRVHKLGRSLVWTLFVTAASKAQKWGYLEQNDKGRWEFVPYAELRRPIPGYSLHFGDCPLWSEGEKKR